MKNLLERIERVDKIKLFDTQPYPVIKLYTAGSVESQPLTPEDYQALLAHLKENGWKLDPLVTSGGVVATRRYTHNITCSQDKDSMARWQAFLSGKGVPCQVKPHPIFGWGVFTDQGHINEALLLKEQFSQLTNVLTGEIVREGI